MSAGTAVKVRDLSGTFEEQDINIDDMPAGELTVQHILGRAGVKMNKRAVLVDGRRSTATSKVDPGSEILMIPNVANG